MQPEDPSYPAPPPPETIIVRSKRVACDGGGGPLGHPLVYMEMGEEDFVECGYCDRRFELSPDQKPPARATQVLDHQKSQTAERDARPENESDQVRLKESVFGVARKDRENNPEKYADQSDAGRDFLDSS